jgi:hypothetical protein
MSNRIEYNFRYTPDRNVIFKPSFCITSTLSFDTKNLGLTPYSTAVIIIFIRYNFRLITFSG